MELMTFHIPKSLKRLVIAPIGDIQWSGENGPTAQESLERFIGTALEMDAYFVGMGDMIDFLSPSNRRRLISADLYDTAQDVIHEKAMELTQEVFDKFLKPTKGRWISICEGHHFYEGHGTTSDMILADMLKARFVGTSAYVRIPNANFTYYHHHGVGGGVLPTSTLNKLYHLAAGLEGADVYMLGHDTKIASIRLSRPYPDWVKKKLIHRDIWLIRTGGFSKSNVEGHRFGNIPRGDYAEQRMLTPSPLTAPIIKVDLCRETDRIRVDI